MRAVSNQPFSYDIPDILLRKRWIVVGLFIAVLYFSSSLTWAGLILSDRVYAGTQRALTKALYDQTDLAFIDPKIDQSQMTITFSDPTKALLIFPDGTKYGYTKNDLFYDDHPDASIVSEQLVEEHEDEAESDNTYFNKLTIQKPPSGMYEIIVSHALGGEAPFEIDVSNRNRLYNKRISEQTTLKPQEEAKFSLYYHKDNVGRTRIKRTDSWWDDLMRIAR